MNEKRKLEKVAARFDGAATPPGEVERLIAADPECAAHLDMLRLLREGAEAARQAPRIEDAQFPAFMAGIREGIAAAEAAPVRVPFWRRGFWQLASACTAALIAAFSLFWMVAEGPAPAAATVEDAWTEVEGATVDWYDSKTGVTTVWVTMHEEDLW